jgi:hypothetical protein
LDVTGYRKYSAFVEDTPPAERRLIVKSIAARNRERSPE